MPANRIGAPDTRVQVGGLARITMLSKIIVALTAVVAGATLITALLTVTIAGDATDFLAGDLTESQFRSRLAPLSAVQSLAAIATLVTGVLTIVWMYRIASNLRAVGRRTTWHPLFSIFGWFLPPFFLYVLPFLTLREQWKASAADDGSEQWRGGPDNRLLWGWFALYGIVPLVFFATQVGSIAGSEIGAGDVERIAKSLDDVSALTFLQAASVIGAAVCWILFVRQLTRRHVALTNE
jgi:hypothetical protein